MTGAAKGHPPELELKKPFLLTCTMVFASLFGHTQPTSTEIVLALLATGALVTLGAVAVFRISDRRAKQAGLYDRTTGS